MRKIVVFILFVAFIVTFSVQLQSCSEEKKPVKKEKKEESLIEIKDGIFTEYYPGRKAVKMQGPQDEKGIRNGRWKFFAENGVEMSMTEYKNGLKEGFTFVRFPNGAMRYNGEYHEDKQAGIWRYYDEQGKVIQEIDYSKLTK